MIFAIEKNNKKDRLVCFTLTWLVLLWRAFFRIGNLHYFSNLKRRWWINQIVRMGMLWQHLISTEDGCKATTVNTCYWQQRKGMIIICKFIFLFSFPNLYSKTYWDYNWSSASCQGVLLIKKLLQINTNYSENVCIFMNN